MTHQEIKELAGHRDVPPWVVKLVGDAVAKEREKCAIIAEEWFCGCGRGSCSEGDRRAHDIADSIRARGQEC